MSSSYVTNGRLLINEEMGVEGGGDALKSRADTLYVCGERIYFAVPPGYVDKILRRAKPGDIPVEQPTKFDIVIS